MYQPTQLVSDGITIKPNSPSTFWKYETEQKAVCYSICMYVCVYVCLYIF